MFDNLTFRMSDKNDLPALKDLMRSQFGNREQFGVFCDIVGRYYVAENECGKIIAMTGLNYGGPYNGPEIDWTCVDDEYKHKGLMTKMIGDVIANCKDDVYCSCWREYGKDINLKHAMAVHGFIPVQVPRITYTTEYNKCDIMCTHFKPCHLGNCSCCEDLYVRYYK